MNALALALKGFLHRQFNEKRLILAALSC